jgi:hypothetical protein
MKRGWKNIAGALLGIAIAGIMFFANQLGMDNDPAWGLRRYILFFLGITIIIVSMLYREDNFMSRIFNTQTGQLYLASGVLALSIIIVYIWCVTFGLWNIWPKSTNYYDQLATSFSHGQLALEVEPDPALLVLENLYEPGNREGIPFPLDVTLYEGKYYLYWGPAPALLLSLTKPFYANEIGDNILTFVFTAGTFLFLAFLILELWKNYYPETPRWAILLGIAFTGLVNPTLFILLDARIYEAAIVSGQFFLVGGLYWLFTAFNRPSIARLSLAGIFFAFAVGSRMTLILPIAFLMLITLIWAIKSQRAKAFTFILTIALPLLLGAIGYAWYNYARFGSVTETGFRYALTTYNLHEASDETFSFAYIPPNLFKTLLNPFERRSNSFPFIWPTRPIGPSWFAGNYPKLYTSQLAEFITGILIGSPFVIFAFLAGLRRKKDTRWIVISLAGSSLLIFLAMQVFFFTTMRYLLDLIPMLSLLAVIGFWQGFHLLQAHRAVRLSLATLGIGLCTYTFVVSFLLAISAHWKEFRALNPVLLKQLIWIFNGLFK